MANNNDETEITFNNDVIIGGKIYPSSFINKLSQQVFTSKQIYKLVLNVNHAETGNKDHPLPYRYIPSIKRWYVVIDNFKVYDKNNEEIADVDIDAAIGGVDCYKNELPHISNIVIYNEPRESKYGTVYKKHINWM